MGDTERVQEWQGGVAVCAGLGRARVIPGLTRNPAEINIGALCAPPRRDFPEVKPTSPEIARLTKVMANVELVATG